MTNGKVVKLIRKEVDVAAGIIFKNKQILIAQRKKTDKLGLLWEIPGGKIEEKESPEECLRRELKEELDINSKVGSLFCISKHNYPDFKINLMAYLVDSHQGELKVNDHEQIKWASISELKEYEFAPADIPIINKLLSEYNE